ncbi:MAG: phosphate-starvation-inducible PsiE family protein [Pseudomonadota bacterium]
MTQGGFHRVERYGNILVDAFHILGLFVIGTAIAWATWDELVHIVSSGGPKIKDILLLFIYLELVAMVGIYFKTKRLPVRFLIYIAITALTRLLAIEVKSMEGLRMLEITGAILMLTLAVLVIRYGAAKFPTDESG